MFLVETARLLRERGLRTVSSAATWPKNNRNQPGRLVPPSPAYLRYVPKNAKMRCQASSAASLSYFSRANAVSGAIGAGLGLMKLCPASG